MDDTIDLLQIKIERAKNSLPESALNAIAAVDWRAVILRMREKRGYSFEQLEDLELETELVLCGLLNPKDYPRELEKRMGLSRAQTDELVKEMNDEVFSKIKEELIKNSERKRIFAKKASLNSPLEEYPAPVSKKLGLGEVDNFEMRPPRPLSTKSTPQEGNNNHDTEEQKKINTAVLNSAGIQIINKKEESATVPSSSIPPREAPLAPSARTIEAVQPGEEKKELPSILAQKLSTSVQVPTVKTEHSLDNITKSANTDSGIIKSSKIDPYREIPE